MSVLPSDSDYLDAAQNPAFAFDDPELKRSTFKTGLYDLPHMVSGNFACVFEAEVPRRLAVRCFRTLQKDRETRYRAIERALDQHGFPFTKRVQHVSKGIHVKGAWYPIVKMEWAEGVNLYTYVNNTLDKDPSRLVECARHLLEIHKTLYAAGVAHGDLQPDNLVVGTGGQLTLIDYDGMFLPELARFASAEGGLRHCQHPGRGEDFGRHIDNFSVWVLYTSLLAYAKHPEWWHELEPDPQALFFEDRDFVNPDSSTKFRLLEKCRFPDLRCLGSRLRRFLSDGFAASEVPPPAFLLDSARRMESMSAAVPDIARLRACLEAPLQVDVPDPAQEAAETVKRQRLILALATVAAVGLTPALLTYGGQAAAALIDAVSMAQVIRWQRLQYDFSDSDSLLKETVQNLEQSRCQLEEAHADLCRDEEHWRNLATSWSRQTSEHLQACRRDLASLEQRQQTLMARVAAASQRLRSSLQHRIELSTREVQRLQTMQTLAVQKMTYDWEQERDRLVGIRREAERDWKLQERTLKDEGDKRIGNLRAALDGLVERCEAEVAAQPEYVRSVELRRKQQSLESRALSERNNPSSHWSGLLTIKMELAHLRSELARWDESREQLKREKSESVIACRERLGRITQKLLGLQESRKARLKGLVSKRLASLNTAFRGQGFSGNVGSLPKKMIEEVESSFDKTHPEVLEEIRAVESDGAWMRRAVAEQKADLEQLTNRQREREDLAELQSKVCEAERLLREKERLVAEAEMPIDQLRDRLAKEVAALVPLLRAVRQRVAKRYEARIEDAKAALVQETQSRERSLDMLENRYFDRYREIGGALYEAAERLKRQCADYDLSHPELRNQERNLAAMENALARLSRRTLGARLIQRYTEAVSNARAAVLEAEGAVEWEAILTAEQFAQPILSLEEPKREAKRKLIAVDRQIGSIKEMLKHCEATTLRLNSMGLVEWLARVVLGKVSVTN